MSRRLVVEPTVVEDNVYERLLDEETRLCRGWPMRDRGLLDDLRAGVPVVVFGFLVGFRGHACRVARDGTVTGVSSDTWPVSLTDRPQPQTNGTVIDWRARAQPTRSTQGKDPS